MTVGVLALTVAGCSAPSAFSGPAGGDGQAEAPAASPPVTAGSAPAAEPSTAAEPSSAAEPGSAAAAVSIPEIDVTGDLIGLGLAEDRTLEVPEDAAQLGWYTGGGRPGGPGPTVIVGHIDSRTGPGVFYRLPELGPGDRIEVEAAGGRTVEYVVDRVADYSKTEFPTEQVFGVSPDDELRLITCTGPWMEAAASYRDNHVVFATAAQD